MATKHFSSLLLWVLLAFFALCHASFAQTRTSSRWNDRPDAFKPSVALGVETGINYNLFSEDSPSLPPVDVARLKSSGTGIGGYIGGLVDLSLTPTVGLQFHVTYDENGFGSSASTTRLVTVYDETGVPAELMEAPFQITSRIAASSVDLSVLTRVEVCPSFSLIGGLTMQNLDGTVTATTTYRSLDSTVRFADGGMEASVQQDITALIPSRRYALDLGASYSYRLNAGTTIAPTLSFRYYLTPFGRDYTEDGYRWQNVSLNTLRFGATVTFGL